MKARGSARGAALVELAVSLPLLVLIVVGTIDFARAFRVAIALNNAARAGAQFGALNTINSSNSAGMVAAANASAASDLGSVSASASRTCVCATDTNPNVGWPSPNSCTGSCGTNHMVVIVTVTAAQNFSTITRFPGIPHSLSITRSATLRAQ